MSIGELNATRSAGAPDAIANFVAALAAALAADWNHAGGLTTLRRRGIGMPTRCEGYCQ